MIIVKLMDGLGNQMFQYAFARYLQVVYNMPIIFETTKLQSGSYRKLGIQFLNIPLVDNKRIGSQECRFATKLENYIFKYISKLVRIYAEKGLHISMNGSDGYNKMIKWGFYTTNDSIIYHPFSKTYKKNIFVRGYFQSEKYFKDIASIIKYELKVKEINNIQVLKLAEKMFKENSICIHIRRGDYIGSKFFEVCTEKYYREAVEYIIEKVKNSMMYVFSNSIEDLVWIKENYTFLGKAYYVSEGNNEFEDLYLMYHCKHHIISNSTFSWWGSYLKENSDGYTICPEKWNNVDTNEDIILSDWIKLSV